LAEGKVSVSFPNKAAVSPAYLTRTNTRYNEPVTFKRIIVIFLLMSVIFQRITFTLHRIFYT